MAYCHNWPQRCTTLRGKNGSARRSHWSPEQKSEMAVSENVEALVGSPTLSALKGGICHPCSASQTLSVTQFK